MFVPSSSPFSLSCFDMGITFPFHTLALTLLILVKLLLLITLTLFQITTSCFGLTAVERFEPPSLIYNALVIRIASLLVISSPKAS